MIRDKLRVLIVDDSALVRQSLKEILESNPMIEVIATASDPYQAVKIIQNEVPDVITLDIEMPRMDGLTFLKRLMKQHPIPVVIISGYASEGSVAAMKALEFGAIAVIPKPKLTTKEFFEESSIMICDTVKSAAMARLSTYMKNIQHSVEPRHNADVVLPRSAAKPDIIGKQDKVILIGASTGGTEAIAHILDNLPAGSPGVVIVQHMPADFTRSFAERLNRSSALEVKEAENNDKVLPGKALVAPGGKHLMLRRSGGNYFVQLKEGPLVNRHRPSVDVLFRSGARYAGPNALAVLLTGMGDDGAQGMLELFETGAHTIAQDEDSCVVFGMPKEAIKKNAVRTILPLNQIAPFLSRKF